jgi:oligoribonuclease
MTGLDTSIHRIVEVAVIITDFAFNELASYEAVIYQPEAVIAISNDFSLRAHTESGLYDQVRQSSITDKEASHVIRSLIDAHVPLDAVFLAGNSIRSDRAFIDAYWPEVAEVLHYRMLDVSSFKLWWLGTGHEPFKKGETHRALEDIRESIEELRYYLNELKS